MEKLIITAALTGAQHGKAANPNLPEQPDEIVSQAMECWRAGAAIVGAGKIPGAPAPSTSLRSGWRW